jgi:S-formylglutathione hydrolase FrmB
MSATARLVALVVAVAAMAAGAPAAGAATVVAGERIDRRLLELTVRTPALAVPTKVRVLLPDGYGRKPRRRYPVLYLLHGAGDDRTAWTRSGDAERTTAGRPLIVVMPDGGRGGWYTDWYNAGRGGPPAWETLHVRELIRLVDRRFRTVAARRGRAIAGLSMGGFGAFSYAARHPDLFTAAASFSGGLDLNLELLGQPAGRIAVDATAAMDGGDASSVFGDFAAANIRWRGHNPPDLAVNLRGVALAMHSGDGRPGGPLGGDELDIVELGTHEMSARLHDRLARLRIPHVWDDHGPGSHTWPYWARDLRETVGPLMRRFARPPAPRRTVTLTSVERSFTAFGWHVALRRPNVEFATLRRAGRRGFALTGSGRAVVTTPAHHRPGSRHVVRIARGDAVTTRRIAADGAGRLRVALRLAPANRADQGSPAAQAGGTWHRATAAVRIARR